jgi:ABC-2 type transport system ATP-binding protein
LHIDHVVNLCYSMFDHMVNMDCGVIFMEAIQIDSLSKSYGKSRGIVDVSFDVHKGELFGFIGPNGAGKSTTIRSLLGLVRPDGGRAEILGMDILKDSVAIRRRTGYLPSEVYFTENRKVQDTLLYAASFYRQDLKVRILSLSARLDLDLKKKVDDLSLGNKKKVAVVLALMHSPELIVLDEPTAGLDPLMQKEFFDIIHEERGRGATVLLSSHVLSEVQRHCDRVAVIREGRILFVRPVADMMKQSVKRVTATARAGGTNEFVFDGEINSLTQRLAGEDLADLLVEELPLEDVFLKLYRKEDS